MADLIHPTAIVDPGAVVGAGTKIGPYAVIGAEVTIGDGCELGAGARIEGPALIGSGNRIFSYACIGFEPQDLKFQGGDTRLEVGDDNIFREFCTIHRGTEKGGGLTSIGDGSLFMAYTHIAHDCHVGSRTIFSNNATLAGHVIVEDDAIVGAFSAVHQFCRVGRHAYIGGYSAISKDALPWSQTVGQKPVCLGLNSIGLRRKGFDEETISLLGEVMRVLLRAGLNKSQAIERIEAEFPTSTEVEYLLDFLRTSERGVITSRPGQRRSTRGGSSD